MDALLEVAHEFRWTVLQIILANGSYGGIERDDVITARQATVAKQRLVHRPASSAA